MRRFRIVLIVAGVIAVLGGLGGAAAFWFTRGAATAADAFLAAVAHDGPEAAYAMASPVFRSSGTAAQFAQGADAVGLRKFRSASWSSREISGGTAKLEGTVSLGDGGTIPMTVRLVKDDAGAWRVLSLDIPKPGLAIGGEPATAAPALPPPDEAGARQLAQLTLQQLVEAIRADDFRGLRLASAPAMQKQFTAEALAEHFKVFVDAHLDLTRAVMRPVTLGAAPKLDDGVLSVKGSLPADDRPWYFEFEYVPEAGAWLPVSYSLSSHPPSG